MSNDNTPTQAFYRELTLYTSIAICAIFTNFCIIYIYQSTALYLQAQSNPAKSYYIDWNIISSLSMVFVLANIVLIWFNKRTHFRYRNFRIKSPPENPTTLYLICLPLLTASFVGLTFILVASFAYSACFKYVSELILGFMILIDIVMIILMLIDTTAVMDTGENWNLNLSNFLTIAMSLITLAAVFLFNLFSIHAHSLVNFRQQYFNNTNEILKSCVEKIYHNNSIQYFFVKIVSPNLIYENCCVALITLTAILYFLVPLRDNLHALFNKLRPPPHETSIPDEPQNPAYISDILLNVFLVTVFISMNALVLFITDTHHWLITSLQILELGLLIALTIYILTDVTVFVTAPRLLRVDRFGLIILWLGLIGDITSVTVHCITLLKRMGDKGASAYSVIRAIVGVAIIVQDVLQIDLMCLIQMRQLRSPNFRKICAKVNPVSCLAIMNGVFLLSVAISDHYDRTNQNRITEIVTITYPVSVLYRLYCILSLAKVVLTKTHYNQL